MNLKKVEFSTEVYVEQQENDVKLQFNGVLGEILAAKYETSPLLFDVTPIRLPYFTFSNPIDFVPVYAVVPAGQEEPTFWYTAALVICSVPCWLRILGLLGVLAVLGRGGAGNRITNRVTSFFRNLLEEF